MIDSIARPTSINPQIVGRHFQGKSNGAVVFFACAREGKEPHKMDNIPRRAADVPARSGERTRDERVGELKGAV